MIFGRFGKSLRESPCIFGGIVFYLPHFTLRDLLSENYSYFMWGFCAGRRFVGYFCTLCGRQPGKP
jgi:hypothetical protein